MAILIERKRRRRRKDQTTEAAEDGLEQRHQYDDRSGFCSRKNIITHSIPTNQMMIMTPQAADDFIGVDNKQVGDNINSNSNNNIELRPTNGERTQFSCKMLLQHCKVRPSSSTTITKSLRWPTSAIIFHNNNKRQSGASLSSLFLLLLLSVAFLLMLFTNLIAASNSAATILNSNNKQQSQQQQQQQMGSQFSSNSVIVAPTSVKARYKTSYACEDRQLTMDCDYGSKINLIRANFGRFSITQCNEQGQLDLSTDCMSPITLRIMSERCQDKQKCSVNATSTLFGDKCPKTRKYLEVHFQCQPDPLRIGGQIDPPDRVDLRNQSQNLQPNQQPHIVYPPPTNSGSSNIMPANNNQYPANNSPHQPRPQSSSPSAPSNGQSMEDSMLSVQQQQPSLIRPQFQPQQQQQPSTITVMNSEILNYTSIADLKPTIIYNPNIISPEPSYVVALRHLNTENMSNPRCFLWDNQANQWTEQGGRIIDTNSTHTICAFDQATSYLLVMDYAAPSSYPTISHINPTLIQQNNQQQHQPMQPATQQQQLPSIVPNNPQIGSPYPGILDLQPVVLPDQQQQPSPSLTTMRASEQRSSIVRFFSIFGYLIAFVFVAVALMTIAFVASTMRSSAGAALKSLGNFTAFSGHPKYKAGGRRADGTLHNKDLLVINNQNGHQFLYAPGNTTKINSSSSTHILSGLAGQHQGTLHQIQQQQQQQQMYSGNGTLSNLSGTGGQSNNYYYGLMGLTPLFPQHQQQQQSQLQHHLSQHHLNQQAQMSQQQQQAVTPASYHHQANKSTISTESANSTPSSSGVESGSTSMHNQQQQQQQANCLMMNNDFSLMGNMTNHYGQHQGTLLAQPTLTLNAHYSSSGVPLNVAQQPLDGAGNMGNLSMNTNGSMREHIYECVDEDKPYTARLLLPMSLNPSEQQQQFNSNTLGLHQQHLQQQHWNPQNSSRALTLSTRLLQNAIQQQQQQPNLQQQQQQQANKRLFSHPAIIRDNQTKTNIICSKLAQVTPQRATEINKFQHDVMAIYNGGEFATTTAAPSSSSSSGNSSTCYGSRPESTTNTIGLLSPGNNNKLSTDC